MGGIRKQVQNNELQHGYVSIQKSTIHLNHFNLIKEIKIYLKKIKIIFLSCE